MALVSLSGEDAVIAIDIGSGRMSTRFPVVKGPDEISLLVDSGRARKVYVPHLEGKGVSVIDRASCDPSGRRQTAWRGCGRGRAREDTGPCSDAHLDVGRPGAAGSW
jgi:hypothetical protein